MHQNRIHALTSANDEGRWMMKLGVASLGVALLLVAALSGPRLFPTKETRVLLNESVDPTHSLVKANGCRWQLATELRKAKKDSPEELPVETGSRVHFVAPDNANQSTPWLRAMKQGKVDLHKLSRPHKMKQSGQNMFFIYGDNTVVSADAKSCLVTGLFEPTTDRNYHPDVVRPVQDAAAGSDSKNPPTSTQPQALPPGTDPYPESLLPSGYVGGKWTSTYCPMWYTFIHGLNIEHNVNGYVMSITLLCQSGPAVKNDTLYEVQVYHPSRGTSGVSKEFSRKECPVDSFLSSVQLGYFSRREADAYGERDWDATSMLSKCTTSNDGNAGQLSWQTNPMPSNIVWSTGFQSCPFGKWACGLSTWYRESTFFGIFVFESPLSNIKLECCDKFGKDIPPRLAL